MMDEHLFAQILKKLRHQKGLSQEELALRSGLHRTYLSQLERGLKTPTLKTMYKLSQVLELRLSELIVLMENELER